MSMLIAVRHGHVNDRHQLSSMGAAGIRNVAHLIKGLLAAGTKPLIVSSPCSYAKQSAAIVAEIFSSEQEILLSEGLLRDDGPTSKEEVFVMSRARVTIAITHLPPLMNIIDSFVREGYTASRNLTDSVYITSNGCIISHRERCIESLDAYAKA